MTRSLRLMWVLGALCAVPFVAGCDAWQCLWANTQAVPLNPDFLKPFGAMLEVGRNPVYVAVSPDGLYAAVASEGLPATVDPRGVLSLVLANPTDPNDPNNIEQQTIEGEGPYGLLWLSDYTLLVCNEGPPNPTGATQAFLLRVDLVRGSEFPSDPSFGTRSIGFPPNALPVAALDVFGPSEAVVLPGTSAADGTSVIVSTRFSGGVLLVPDVTRANPAAVRAELLLQDTNDPNSPIDEPRGIDLSTDGSRLWICNYGKGANHRTALALAKELIAAKLNRFRGVPGQDPNALDSADEWIAANPDLDGRLPYRWTEPDDGPDDDAVVQAEALIADLTGFNSDPNCTDASDPNCPLTPEQWVARDPDTWPTDPNVDPNLTDPSSLVLGDPVARYPYTSANPGISTVLGILSRQTEADGEVTVYSVPGRSIEARISVPPRPRSVRLTPDESLAVVTCSGYDGLTGSVVIISTSSLTIVAQRELNFVPALVRIHAEGARAYISAWTGEQMAVINLRNLCPATVADPTDTRVYTVFDRPVAIDTTGNPDVLWCASYGLNQATPLDIFEGKIRLP